MEATNTIFQSMLKEHKTNPQLPKLISELCYELSRKKIQRLKDESNIQNRLGELFELYCHALQEEDLKTPQNLGCVIDGLLKASNHDKEAFLYKAIYEKEQLEKSIFQQKQQIRSSIAQTFEVLEQHMSRLPEGTKIFALTALDDAKLRGIEMLGILKETTQEAILTTLEKGQDVKDTVYEITKNLTFQTINEGNFNKRRILDISQTVIDASVEIADEDLGFAKEILEGSINGVKDGITKAIDKFKNDLKFAPTEEMEGLLEGELSLLRKELLKIDEHFIELLESIAIGKEGMAGQLLREMLLEMNSSVAKLKRAANEAKEVVGERIESLKVEALALEKTLKERAEKRFETLKKDVSDFEKIASSKVESLKQFEFESDKAKQMAAEAKKLGFRAWEVAKSMADSAIKGAKEAMKKDDK